MPITITPSQPTNLIKFTKEGAPQSDIPISSQITEISSSTHSAILLERIVGIPEMGEKILENLIFQDALSFRAVNREFYSTYSSLLEPKVYEKLSEKVSKEAREVNEYNIKIGEIYFPKLLRKILRAESVERRIDGLQFINMYLQKILHTSKNILESDLNKTINDLYSSATRWCILHNKRQDDIEFKIRTHYTKIFSTIWSWESVFSHFTPLNAPLNLPSCPALDYSIKKCEKNIENLKNTSTLSTLTKLIDPFILICILFSLTMIATITVFTIAIIVTNIIFSEIILTSILSKIMIYIACIVADGYLGILIVKTLIECYGYFDYHYKLPKSLNRLSIKLNKIKDLFYKENTQYKQCNEKFNAIQMRHIYLKYQNKIKNINIQEENLAEHNPLLFNQIVNDPSLFSKLLNNPLIDNELIFNHLAQNRLLPNPLPDNQLFTNLLLDHPPLTEQLLANQLLKNKLYVNKLAAEIIEYRENNYLLLRMQINMSTLDINLPKLNEKISEAARLQITPLQTQELEILPSLEEPNSNISQLNNSNTSQPENNAPEPKNLIDIHENNLRILVNSEYSLHKAFREIMIEPSLLTWLRQKFKKT